MRGNWESRGIWCQMGRGLHVPKSCQLSARGSWWAGNRRNLRGRGPVPLQASANVSHPWGGTEIGRASRPASGARPPSQLLISRKERGERRLAVCPGGKACLGLRALKEQEAARKRSAETQTGHRCSAQPATDLLAEVLSPEGTGKGLVGVSWAQEEPQPLRHIGLASA